MEEKRKNLVLILEDFKMLHKLWKVQIGLKTDEYQIFFAETNEQAFKIFNDHQEKIDIIVVDFSLGKGVTSLPFLEKVRPLFKGIMIANSSEPRYNKILMRKGCEIEANKDNTVDIIISAM